MPAFPAGPGMVTMITTDDRPEARELLTAAPGLGLLEAAVTASERTAPTAFEATTIAVHDRPGAETSAVYRVAYDRVDADGAARRVSDVLAAAVGADLDASDRVAVLEGAGSRVAVWRRADDPRLPGLAAALDPAVQAPLLPAAGALRCAVLAYRPLRRAVVRVTDAAAPHAVRAYAKVLRPERADAVERRARLVADAGIAPAVLGTPAPGVVVLAPAAGRRLTDVLHAGSTAPTPESVLDLLDRLPGGAVDLRRRRAWSERLHAHLGAAVRALPGEAVRIAALGEAVEHVLATAPAGPVVPTHGDLSDSNVVVREGRAVGLIDLDTVGPGHRVDDLACLLAHVDVLPDLAPAAYGHVRGLADDWADAFGAAADAASLAARTAAVTLSLVAGARTADERRARLSTAERWLDRARAV